MDIQFKSKSLAKTCNSEKAMTSSWGARRSKILGRRIQHLRLAVTLDDMRNLPGDCHEYKHRAGVFTLDLDGGWRLFFKPNHDPEPLLPDEVSLDWTKVTSVVIEEVKDPHE